MTQATFADFLKFFRMRGALTQEELAGRTGVSVRAIRDMERGRARRPQRRTVNVLAQGLGISVEETYALRRLARSDAGPPVAQVTGMPLPATVPDLVGRDAELDKLTRCADEGGNPQVVVVHGPPGIGKTALAVAAGHRLADRFPDGSFFVDMRGLDRHPLNADAAIFSLLGPLGVDTVPTEATQRLNLYRSLLHDRTVLLILDNPVAEAAIRPLLATSPGSMVLITSRSTLAGLATSTRFELGLLSPDDGVRLLATAAGGDRLVAEPAAAEEIVQLCGRIPLALRIAGARLAASPEWGVADLARRLGAERLTILATEDQQVRTAFQLSYGMLPARTAAVFRRLSLIYGVDAGVELAAVAADEPAAVVQSALDDLVDANLVRAGSTPGRYGFHDLIRIFAVEHARREGQLDGTHRRMTGWLLSTALEATAHFQTAPPRQSAFPDRKSADTWLAEETSNWLGALRAATPERVLSVANAMHWYSDYRGDGELWEEVFSAGAAAAEALGRTSDLAAQLNFLCWALAVPLGNADKALAVHHRAMAAALEADNPVEQGWACYYRSGIEKRFSNLAEAVAYATRAAETFAAAGHSTGEYLAMTYLGVTLHHSGDHRAALEVHERAITLHRATTKTPNTTSDDNLAAQLVRYAECLGCLDRVPEALAALAEAEQRCGTTGQMLARVLFLRGRILARSGDLPAAHEHLAAALEMTGIPDLQVQLLTALADVSDELGVADEARAHRIQALMICDQFDLPELRPHIRALSAKLDA